MTESAVRDERFSGLESVSRGGIEAVLCARSATIRRTVCSISRIAPLMASSPRRTARRRDGRLPPAPLVDRLLVCHAQRTVADHTAPILRLSARSTSSASTRSPPRCDSRARAPLESTSSDGGTGMQEPARARDPHNGARASHPFLTLNCAALPENADRERAVRSTPWRAFDRDAQDRRQGRGRGAGHPVPRRDRRASYVSQFEASHLRRRRSTTPRRHATQCAT